MRKSRNEIVKLLETCSTPSQPRPSTVRQSFQTPAAVPEWISRSVGRTINQGSPSDGTTKQAAEASSVRRPASCAQLEVTNIGKSHLRVINARARGDEEFMRQLTELAERFEEKNLQIDEKQNELDVAVRDKTTMEMEMRQQLQSLQSEKEDLQHARDQDQREKEALQHSCLEMRQQLQSLQREKETLLQAHNEERREKESLLQTQDEERRGKEAARQEKALVSEQKARLQLEFDEQQREKTTLEQQVQSLRQNVYQLDELLAGSRAATEEIRQMLRQSEEVRSIPSRDIHLTDQKLGEGSYGEVRIAYWQGCPVAVKMLYEALAVSQHNIQLLLQEVSIGWKIHHPNIAGVCGVTLELEAEKKTAWIVMELLQGSMASLIKAPQKGVPPLTLREQVDMAHDSLCGLNYLHSLARLVLHGDIRPTNILVTAVMRAKLGDLGAARFSDATLSVGLVSPEYTAPERVDGRSQKCKETDIYSMGVTLCELFTGLPPSPRARMDQVQRIRQRDVRVLCNRMVARDNRRRPPAEDALAVFGRIHETDEYKSCPPRRMVKGKIDGEDDVTLTDHMW